MFRIISDLSKEAVIWINDGDEVDVKISYMLRNNETGEIRFGYGDKPEHLIRQGFEYKEQGYYVVKCSQCETYH